MTKPRNFPGRRRQRQLDAHFRETGEDMSYMALNETVFHARQIRTKKARSGLHVKTVKPKTI